MGFAAELDTLGERLGIEDHGYRDAEHRAHLAGLLGCLSDRQRTVVRLRFVDDLTQREIGERIGVSQIHVYRLLRDALERLHAEDRWPAAASGTCGAASAR